MSKKLDIVKYEDGERVVYGEAIDHDTAKRMLTEAHGNDWYQQGYRIEYHKLYVAVRTAKRIIGRKFK